LVRGARHRTEGLVGDWNRMIRDVITAQRTGEPVLYDDDE
jgi:hypothetical protein